MRVKMPRCEKRMKAGGIWMCRAIGCCDVGDMACECPYCLEENGGTCPRKKALDGPEVHIR